MLRKKRILKTSKGQGRQHDSCQFDLSYVVDSVLVDTKCKVWKSSICSIFDFEVSYQAAVRTNGCGGEVENMGKHYDVAMYSR